MTYKSIVDNISNFYDIYKSPKYIKHNWVIVNNKHYELNKGKIKIISANYYTAKAKVYNEDDEVINHNQIIVNAETLNKYITIRYNANFIALSESDTEYGMITKEMELLAIRKMDSKKIHTDIPSFELVLKVLGYKITRKAYKDILDQIEFYYKE